MKLTIKIPIKECRQCEKEKYYFEFSPDHRNNDGLHCYCKKCRAAYAKAVRKGN